MSEDELSDPHDDCPACRSAGLSRRRALGLGLAAGAAAVVAPRLSASPGVVDLASARPAAAPNPYWPAPPIVTRAQWGADESLRSGGITFDSKVEKLIVHHTVTPNNPSDPAAYVRGAYRYHTQSRGYWDIAYNFLIDHRGRIYEGRWAQDYAGGGVHDGERGSKQVRGAHTGGHNVKTIGVALLGTYTSVTPPPAMREALVTLLTWKCARWGIDPLASTVYASSTYGTRPLPDIMGHRDAKPTTCPGDPVLGLMPSMRQQVANRLRGGERGYWIVDRSGTLVAFGDMPDWGDTERAGIRTSIRGIAGHPSGRGYWLVADDGGIFTFGTARFFGSMGGRRLNAPIIGLEPTPSGNGYWLLGRDGGIFTFGDARFHGSTGGIRLNAPVIGMRATPSGKGYWLLASDGGIFCFGDARFYGSTGNIRLNQPVVAMAATPSGRGYWLAARDGGIFCFGDATFRGSTGGIRLNQPIVDVAASHSGKGYALLAADGGIFTFGDAPFFGSAAGKVSDAVGFAGKLKR